MDQRVYLDHAATTPLDPQVLDAMLRFLRGEYGNPSALYAEGRRARQAVDHARDLVAALLGAESPKEIIFTSSGTEADNLALLGTAHAARRAGRGNHLVVSGIEHQAVLNTARHLESEGFRVTYVAPEADGIVACDRVMESVTDKTVLVSLMLANNEVGTLQPVKEVAAACRSLSVPVHTDAVQAVGQIPVDVRELGVDLLSLSAHKFYGPKGVGVLYVRQGVELAPQMHGGGQELERRAGTENVAGIVGLAKALELAVAQLAERTDQIRDLRSRLIDGILERVPDVTVNGHPEQTLPGVANLSFLGVDAESLLLNLDMAGVAASSGSACSAGSVEPSYVLMAMGRSRETARQSLRFSLGHTNTASEIDYVIETVARLVQRLRRR